MLNWQRNFSECCCVSRFILSPNPQLGSVYTKGQRIFGSFTVLFRCIYVDVVCGFILLSLLASDFFPLSFLSFISHVCLFAAAYSFRLNVLRANVVCPCHITTLGVLMFILFSWRRCCDYCCCSAGAFVLILTRHFCIR